MTRRWPYEPQLRKDTHMIGPGKYDDLCTRVKAESKAEAVIVIVIKGVRGSGFSLQTDNPMVIINLPDVLQTVAAQIKEDLDSGKL